ncbi:hypothetical protein EYF80_052355 [Liparis tanakae]|uniref:Transmembrane protein 26 n=1 Tax=Liparis tanakae TaxID=230148 RepID=A0A4Z2F998_9TELE|nr:hypothetical protein EYF80_052355 [Liparis tanakae]
MAAMQGRVGKNCLLESRRSDAGRRAQLKYTGGKNQKINFRRHLQGHPLKESISKRSPAHTEGDSACQQVTIASHITLTAEACAVCDRVNPSRAEHTSVKAGRDGETVTGRPRPAMCRLLNVLLALLSRVLFAAHGAVAVWRVVAVRGEPFYWLLLTGVALLAVEMSVTLKCTRNAEWKW